MTDREKIISDDYYDVLSDFTRPENLPAEVRDYVYQRIDQNLGVTYINKEELERIGFRDFTYRSIPKIYGLSDAEPAGGSGFDPTPLLQSGVLQTQREPLNLTGKGVVIGFLDTGVRYDEAVFQRPDGSTRILGIWDQNNNDGAPPAGLLYGTEYTREDIDAALLSGDGENRQTSRLLSGDGENRQEGAPERMPRFGYDENGHGTALSAVAAGSASQSLTGFVGAAPDADIVVVKLRQAKPFLREYYQIPETVPAYSESDLLTALKYLENYAVSLVRPLVICVGLVTNLGDHAGHSILSGYLNTIATRRSRAVAVCGGDEGNSAHHYEGYATEGLVETTDLAEIRVEEGVRGFVAELWGTVPTSLSVSIRSPGGENTERVDFKVRESRDFSFVFEETKIRIEHVPVEEGSGDELIFFRFTAPTPGVWTIRITIRGEAPFDKPAFHMWLPIRNFLEREVSFLRPAPYVTLTEPSNTREVITTSYYRSENGSFYGQSGRGFSRQTQRKPDLCTPGVEVDTPLGRRTGSGMAVAILAGICAQFMQWAVVEDNRRWVESRELKNYLIRGAVRREGEIYPSREWGYGTVDIEKTFEVIAGL